MTSNRFTEIVRMFAKYGFINTPLSSSEIDQLITWGWPDDEIYQIGCDCEAGLSFHEALDCHPI